MWLDTWNRIKATLIFAKTDLLADSGITLTVPEAVPRAAQSYEHFFAVVGGNPITFSQSASAQGEYKEYDAPMVFSLDIFSMQILTDYDVRMMSNMFTVIDAVVDTFNSRPRLEDANGKGMRFLNPTERVLLSAGRYNVEPFPKGSNDNRHHFGATITVPYQWVCPGLR
jgi:hypothetical protein